MTKKFMISILLILIFGVNQIYSKVTFKEVRTASNNVIVAFLTSDTVNIEEVGTSDLSQRKINGQPAKSIHKYVMQANQCNHHIYLGEANIDVVGNERTFKMYGGYHRRGWKEK